MEETDAKARCNIAQVSHLIKKEINRIYTTDVDAFSYTYSAVISSSVNGTWVEVKSLVSGRFKINSCIGSFTPYVQQVTLQKNYSSKSVADRAVKEFIQIYEQGLNV